MNMLMVRRKAYRRFGARLARWCKVRTLSDFMRLTSRHINWRNARRHIHHARRHQRIYEINTRSGPWYVSRSMVPNTRTAILNLIHFEAQPGRL